MQFSWQDKTIAVTGATGFIGGRLVERLVLEYGARVRCLVRDYTHCASLSRLDVELVKCDLLSQPSLSRAVDGCSYVVHCAYSWDKDRRIARRINVEGTRNLYEVASSAGVASLRPLEY